MGKVLKSEFPEEAKEIALGGHKPEIITLNSKIKDS